MSSAGGASLRLPEKSDSEDRLQQESSSTGILPVGPLGVPPDENNNGKMPIIPTGKMPVPRGCEILRFLTISALFGNAEETEDRDAK
jgi:hypothetical protein